jgi:hypothetical protein
MSEHSGGIGDRPIEPEFREMMQGVARGLDDVFNQGRAGKDRKVGFVLLLFHMNETGERESRCNYISNADRADIVTMMKEQISRWEGMAEQKPGHA